MPSNSTIRYSGLASAGVHARWCASSTTIRSQSVAAACSSRVGLSRNKSREQSISWCASKGLNLSSESAAVGVAVSGSSVSDKSLADVLSATMFWQRSSSMTVKCRLNRRIISTNHWKVSAAGTTISTRRARWVVSC